MSRRKHLWMAVGMTPLLAVVSLAQAPAAPQTSSALRQAVISPPPVPVAKSPVDTFRELLAMNEASLRQFLASRPPEGQKRIRAKLKEYREMTPEERELRLQATDLRWYLLPLLKTPVTNRAEALANVAPAMRKLIDDRLNRWDMLTADEQKALLDNQSTLLYLTDTAMITPEQRDVLLQKMNPERRKQLVAGLDAWQEKTEAQREAMADDFKRFVQLSPDEQQKTLRTLSEPERAQLETTLQAFKSLAPAQRAKCMASFGRLACMSVQERVQFLRNADRWEQMTPTERQQWKDLVHRFSSEPPLPEPVDFPPLPPSVKPKNEPRRPAVTAVATNGQGVEELNR